MNVLFVYSLQKTLSPDKPLVGQEGIQFGISHISSLLKTHGHSTRLVILDRKYGRKNLETMEKSIREFNPQLICFTSVHSEFEFIYDIAGHIKNNHPEIPLLGGGVHITLNPSEDFLDVFDAFCVGEGEYPTLEYVTCLENKSDPTDIQNLWIREGDTIHVNAPRDFIADPDQLPFADREIWQEWILEPRTRLTVLLGRGCPYNCTYCCNHQLRKTAGGKYVRLRNPQNILSEIKLLNKTYPEITEYFLEVETIGVDLKWLETLCALLHELNESETIRLRFGTNLRIFSGIKTEIIAHNLRYAGFDSVIIGLESGNERIREEVLNRKYSNEDILSAVDVLRKHNLKVGIFNMVGLPTETLSDFKDTLRMNQIIQPEWHSTSIFFPYKGTSLYDYALSNNLLPEVLDTDDERQKSVLSMPGFTAKEIQQCFDSFHYNVYRKNKNRKIHILVIYYIMRYIGHNRMADLKITFIRFLYRTGLYNIARKHRLLGIFQKV